MTDKEIADKVREIARELLVQNMAADRNIVDWDEYDNVRADLAELAMAIAEDEFGGIDPQGFVTGLAEQVNEAGQMDPDHAVDILRRYYSKLRAAGKKVGK